MKTLEQKRAEVYQWRKDNPDKVIAQRKRYYAKYKAKVLARHAEWVKNNPEKQKAHYKKWCQANKEHLRIKSNEYYHKVLKHKKAV